MKYFQLGNSDIEISEIGFGCMSLDLNKGQNAVNDLIRAAYKSGINFFDTADLYDQGLNESMLGEALKPFRDEVILASKVGNVWRPDGSGWDWKPTKKLILTEIDESLRRLQTDYLDLYMLHGGTLEDPIDEIIDAFEILKEKGKIRSYGISSIRPNVIRKFIQHSNMDSVMMQYSLLDRRPEESCLDLLHDHQISVLARGTLAKGLLIDKEPATYLGHEAEQVKRIQDALKKAGNPLRQSLGYVLSHPAVTSAVTGIRTQEQLMQIIDCIPFSISSDQRKAMSKILEPKTYQNHR